MEILHINIQNGLLLILLTVHNSLSKRGTTLPLLKAELTIPSTWEAYCYQ